VPTYFEARGLRFFFTSLDCDEPPHAHVQAGRAIAKFWIDNGVELEGNHGLTATQIRTASRLIRDRRDECLRRWREHCASVIRQRR